MSERKEVLDEFGLALCDKGDTCTHYDCTGERRMADEIVRLRSALTTAERERDEARRDAFAARVDLDFMRHRAERAERVVDAARVWKADQRGWLKPLDEALCQAVEALDAAEGSA